MILVWQSYSMSRGHLYCQLLVGSCFFNVDITDQMFPNRKCTRTIGTAGRGITAITSLKAQFPLCIHCMYQLQAVDAGVLMFTNSCMSSLVWESAGCISSQNVWLLWVPVNSILCIPYARYEYSGCTNETATLCWHFSRDLIFVALFQIRHIGSIYPKPLYFWYLCIATYRR